LNDNLLSLDESIQLANATLMISALSAQERAQLSGTSGFVDRIEIRGATTQTITIERLLTNLVSVMHAHIDITVEGIDGPAGAPVLAGGSVPIVLPLRTNHAHIHNLVIRGGLVGVEYDTTLHYHPGDFGELGDVDIAGARDVGLRVLNPRINGQQAPIMLHDVHIHDAAVGVEIVDEAPFGTIELFGDQVTVADCDLGIKVRIDSTSGNNILQLLRSQVVSVDDCVLVDRVTAGSMDSHWRFRFVHGTYRALDRVFDVESTASGTTAVDLHHLDVRSGILPSSYALVTAPQSAHFNIWATECTLRGPMEMVAGTATSALRMQNNRFEAGALALSLTAGVGDVQWSNFTAFPIDIAPATSALSAPITFTGCELVRSDLNDRSTGRSLLSACFLGGSVISPNVQNQRPQLTPWIGRTTVTPTDPLVGTFVDLAVDLHPGTTAAWMLGIALPDPITTATPYRFYFDLSTATVLPGLYQLASRLRLPIPATPSLRRATFYLQAVQVPSQGQTTIPPLFFPVGALLKVQ
jgi:hypothetical protein